MWRSNHKLKWRQQAVAFQDDSWMTDGPPSCSEADVKVPKLRKCQLDPATISWKDATLLGVGIDGCVWRVNFGDHGPFALKFWDTAPNPDFSYYAAQRECQTAALLQMMKAAVEDSRTRPYPIMVYEDPRTLREAYYNTLAFSDEARAKNGGLSAPGSGFKAIESVPRVPQCYGWLNFNTNLLFKLDPRFRRKVLPNPVEIDKLTREFVHDSNHTGIVYEYVQDGENDAATMDSVACFFHLAGFHYAGTPLSQNWRSSMLVDHADIVHPAGSGWREAIYKIESKHLRLLDVEPLRPPPGPSAWEE